MFSLGTSITTRTGIQSPRFLPCSCSTLWTLPPKREIVERAAESWPGLSRSSRERSSFIGTMRHARGWA